MMRIDPHRATRRRAVSSAALDTPVRVTVRQAVPPTTARSPNSWRCVARSNPPDAATLDQHPELSGDHATRVPCVKGEIVALLPPRALPAGLEVTALFVAPEHQRQGHGPLLIADAASRAVPSLRWRARHASIPPASPCLVTSALSSSTARPATAARPVHGLGARRIGVAHPHLSQFSDSAGRRRRPPRTARPRRAP